jgi:hypothetical protein
MVKNIKKTKEKLLEEKKLIAEGKIGPNISFFQSKVDEVRKIIKDDLIQDTSAPPLICDVTAQDEDVNEDGIIEKKLKDYRLNTVVFSMRMEQDLLTHIKQIAREKSAKLHIDVPYQMLISEAVIEKYPFSNNENKKNKRIKKQEKNKSSKK